MRPPNDSGVQVGVKIVSAIPSNDLVSAGSEKSDSQSNMKILYDGSVYSSQFGGGISRYFENIINRLPSTFTPQLLTTRRNGVIYPQHQNLKSIVYRRFRPTRVSLRLERQYFRFRTANEKFDIAHPTYYTLLTGSDISDYNYPVVLTVYDMIHELYAAKIDPHGEEAAKKKKAILAAQAIICISENTRNDLLKYYPQLKTRVYLTHLAHSIDASMSHGDEPIPRRPYFVYVGSRHASYKNFDQLLFAFADVLSMRPDIVLCVVGAPFSDAERRMVVGLKLSDSVEHFGHASDAQLAKLYRCSIGLVYPSLYEGFGIPPLEAMACETAVIASHSSSLPEVVGDAGILFNPAIKDELTEAMIYLLNDSANREKLIAAGRQRIKHFSWEKTASRTVDVYRAASE